MLRFHHTYIVQCADGTLYTGYAIDIEKRLQEHNGEGASGGARYTRGRRPVSLVYTEKHTNRSHALKREYEIKQLTRRDKQLLIEKYRQDMA